MGGQVTGTPERLSPWPGHRALAATCLLSARVPGLTGGGMGPRWAGLEDRVRARSGQQPHALTGPHHLRRLGTSQVRENPSASER